MVAGIVTGNIIYDKTQKNSIKVEVKDVTAVTDYEGDPAVLVVLDFYNGSKSKKSFMSSVYEEVTQDGREIYYTIFNEPESRTDNDIEPVSPGSSIEIRKAYKLDDPSKPVRIVCSSFDGSTVYVDGEFDVN